MLSQAKSSANPLVFGSDRKESFPAEDEKPPPRGRSRNRDPSPPSEDARLRSPNRFSAVRTSVGGGGHDGEGGEEGGGEEDAMLPLLRCRRF